MVYKVLEKLAQNNSRNYKLEVLQANSDNEDLKKVIFLALDPFTQFYIRKIPEYKRGIHTINLRAAIKSLDHLSSRALTGNAGIEHLKSILESLKEEDANVIERIIKKDLRCGVAEGVVNAVWKDFIHEYPCMLCSKFEQKTVDKIKYPAMVQLKMDGMRFNAIVKNGKVEFRSRNGKEINLLGNLEEKFIELAGGKNVVFDGELVVETFYGSIMDRQTGNGILNKAVKGTISEDEASKVRATVWDIIPYEDFTKGVSTYDYATRFAVLQGLALGNGLVRLVEFKMVQSFEEARDIFNRYFNQGEEGIILKDLSGKWENKRVKHQVKMKGELDCDLEITGFEEGTGKYVGKLGALVCSSNSKDVQPLTVNVGSGFNDDDRDYLWSIRDSLLGKVVALKYNARIINKQGEHSLFLPIFQEIREDKTEADSEAKIV